MGNRSARLVELDRSLFRYPGFLFERFLRSEVRGRLTVCLLMAAGVVLSVNLFVYCVGFLSTFRIMGTLLFSYFFVYLLLQMYFVWYLYCRFKLPAVPETCPEVSVDVFVTAFNEPWEVVEKTLRSAGDMKYPHRTYLLDDSPSRTYKALAGRLRCGYLTREGNLHHKAGNINAAFPRTSGEFIAIFDADHAPEPDFLIRALPLFTGEEIGFVQVMQTFRNGKRNLIAQASTQTAMEYFNITAVCKDQIGATSLHGTNAVIRRKALESIGGYRPGLAEDLETSLALHARGWKSAYLRAPLAPGLTPAGFDAFCKQQLKWSSGVFEAARRAILKGIFLRLKGHQKLAYSVRFSYYLVGLSFFMGMSVTLFHLFKVDSAAYEGFLARSLPLAGIILAIRFLMLRIRALEPEARRGFHFKGASLVFSIWPIYLLSLLCSVFGVRVPFISTPKDAGGRAPLRIIMPQVLMIAALTTGIVWKLCHWNLGPAPFTLFIALLFIGQQWVLSIPLREIVKGRSKAGSGSLEGGGERNPS